MGRTYHRNETFTMNCREYRQMPNIKKKRKRRKVKLETSTENKTTTTTLDIDLSYMILGILICFLCSGEYIILKIIVSIVCFFSSFQLHSTCIEEEVLD